MSKAIAERMTSKAWLVSCWRCKKEIGTMDGPTLSRALIATAHKGGVLCPDCRERSCKICGFELRPSQPDNGVCWFCVQEEETSVKNLVGNIVPIRT